MATPVSPSKEGRASLEGQDTRQGAAKSEDGQPLPLLKKGRDGNPLQPSKACEEVINEKKETV